MAISLHNLAVVYKKQMLSRKAFKLIKKAFALLESADQTDNRFAASLLDKLAELSIITDQTGNFYSKNRRRAIAYLEQAQQIDCRTGGAYQSHMPKRLLQLAKLYFDENDLENACKYYKEACDTSILRHDRQTLHSRPAAQNHLQGNPYHQPEAIDYVASSSPSILDFSPPRDDGARKVSFLKFETDFPQSLS